MVGSRALTGSGLDPSAFPERFIEGVVAVDPDEDDSDDSDDSR